jgi:hypothetical protein
MQQLQQQRRLIHCQVLTPEQIGAHLALKGQLQIRSDGVWHFGLLTQTIGGPQLRIEFLIPVRLVRHLVVAHVVLTSAVLTERATASTAILVRLSQMLVGVLIQ